MQARTKIRINCIVDFRHMRLGTRTRGNRRIAICPKCNRKGERVEHSNGDVEFVHSGVNAIVFLMCAHGHYIKQGEYARPIH